MSKKNEDERPVELHVDPDGPGVKLINFGCSLAFVAIFLLVVWLVLRA
jgi:hypothetical protein